MRNLLDAVLDLSNSARLDLSEFGTVAMDGIANFNAHAVAIFAGRVGGQGRVIVADTARAEFQSLSSGQVIVQRGGYFAMLVVVACMFHTLCANICANGCKKS